MEIIEAQCGRCGEIFNPADLDDTEHVARVDGQYCGGQGAILGIWIRSTKPIIDETDTHDDRP